MRHRQGGRPGKKHRSYLVLFLVVAVAVVLGVTGCTRTFFRNAADKQVEGILAEKDHDPLWRIEQFHVYPDPRSRFADPTDPDHPMMPPDDKDTFDRSPHPQQPYSTGVGYTQGTAWLQMLEEWDTQNRTERRAAMAADREKSGESDGTGKPAAGEKKPDGPPAAPELGKEKEKATDGAGPSGATTESSTGAGYVNDLVKRPIQTLFEEPLRAPQAGYLLKLDQSVEIGVINSNQYQTFREQLYEAALPVTLQRFNFAFQWAATEDWIRQWVGPQATPGTTAPPQVSPTATQPVTTTVPVTPGANNWTGISGLGFSKLFVTGALLTFDFVNTNVFNFAAHKFTSVSTVNLNITQPFLQGGGRAVTLEPLTQAERSLLYAIRAYARFREQYFVGVALGSSLPSQLTPTVSTGGGPISTLAALGIASTDVAGGFVGYLSTLYRECDMACDKKLVRDLERALRIYEGYQEGGLFSPLQVSQVRSTLLQGRNTVLVDQQNVNNALDQFKLLLGLPGNFPLILDDTFARPITDQLDRYYAVIADSDAAYREVEQGEDLDPGQLREALMRIFTRSALVRGTPFMRQVRPAWQAWARLGDPQLEERLRGIRAERRNLLDRKTDLDLKGQSLSEKEEEELRRTEFESDIGALEQVLRRYEARPWAREAREEARRAERIKLFRLVAYSAELVLVSARNDRLDIVGKLWPELPKAPLCDIDLSTAEVGLAQQAAVQHALANRWDLMNQRALLVDAWRQLRVTANALMAVFNVQYNLQSSTPQNGSKPFAFSTGRSASTLAMTTELPLNRLVQRNAYRTALITYQQERRALVIMEDNIAVQVRFDVRQLQLFAANYRIQQEVLKSLYSQVENALELITAPADPAQLQASGTTGAANAAALTNQYLSALQSLNNAQVRMYDIWLSYLATRMQLYLDLESLRMDQRGVWLMLDDPLSSSAQGPDKAPAPGPDSGPGPGRPEELPPPRPAGQALPPPRPVK